MDEDAPPLPAAKSVDSTGSTYASESSDQARVGDYEVVNPPIDPDMLRGTEPSDAQVFTDQQSPGAVLSPLRHTNLFSDDLEGEDGNDADDAHPDLDGMATPLGPSGRKRGRSGLSFRVGSDDTMSLYEKAFLLASQRKKGHIFEPIVGTVFDSEVDAQQYYITYSWEMGFGIRKGKKYVNSNGYKTMQMLHCSCEGTPRPGLNGSVRKACKAMVRLKRTFDDGWYFETVSTHHNHEMADTLGEKRHWQCHNTIDPALKDVIKHLRANNIPLNQVYGVMCDLHGGAHSLPFRKRSLKSTCITISQEASQDDINKLMDLFSTTQLDNGDFYYRVDADENRRVRSIFWTHAKSRADYMCFGDAITFDTTYKCNLYEMPVGLFVGTNNHFQCCLLGCVVLREETVEAFQWAFRSFVTAMKGKHPKTILTDMCRQMEVAISAEFPHTVHRWCKWHVLKNAKEKLGSLYSKGSDFKTEFDILLNFMMTEEEFERGWSDIIGRYNLTDSSYLKQVYDIRHKWAKPYFKGQFCARMTSTQRNECMNHVLKTYVSRSAPLNRFFMQYNKLLADRWGEEDADQAQTKQVVKVLRSGVPAEKHAYKVYTYQMFKYFSDQLFKSGSYIVTAFEDDNKIVVEHIDSERRASWCQIKYGLRADLEKEEYECECGLFEHTGMLCCHVLKVMVHFGVSIIPAKYILKRWTRDARDVLPADIRCYQKDSETGVSKTYRNNILYMKALEIVKLGDQDMDAFAVAVRSLEKAKLELMSMTPAVDVSSEGVAATFPTSTQADQDAPNSGSMPINLDNAKDPDEDQIFEGAGAGGGRVERRFFIPETRRSRGRPPTKRMRGRGERDKAPKELTCAICDSAQHDMSRCPTLEVEDQLSDPGEPDFAENADIAGDGSTNPEDDGTNELPAKRSRSSTPARGGTSKPPSAPRRCKLCGETGHYRPSCPLNDEERPPVASPVCKKCGISGHMSNTCGKKSSYRRA